MARMESADVQLLVSKLRIIAKHDVWFPLHPEEKFHTGELRGRLP